MNPGSGVLSCFGLDRRVASSIWLSGRMALIATRIGYLHLIHLLKLDHLACRCAASKIYAAYLGTDECPMQIIYMPLLSC